MDLDQYVSASIPDPDVDKELYDLVAKHHIHHKCDENPSASCIRERKDGTKRCRFGYPKPFSPTTVVVNDTGRCMYRRVKHDRKFFQESRGQKIEFDERYVMSR